MSGIKDIYISMIDDLDAENQDLKDAVADYREALGQKSYEAAHYKKDRDCLEEQLKELGIENDALQWELDEVKNQRDYAENHAERFELMASELALNLKGSEALRESQTEIIDSLSEQYSDLLLDFNYLDECYTTSLKECWDLRDRVEELTKENFKLSVENHSLHSNDKAADLPKFPEGFSNLAGDTLRCVGMGEDITSVQKTQLQLFN